MTTAPKLGSFKVEPLRKTGRLIDTWKFHGAQKGDKPIEVKVSMVPDGRRIVFVAASEMFESPLQSADINELQAKAEAAAQQYYNAQHHLDWEDWLEVTVEGAARDTPSSGTSFQLSVSYREVKRAVLSSGEAVTVNLNGLLTRFPEPKQATTAGVGASEMLLDDRHDGCEVSYIPATPQNIQALQSIQARMDSLRLALSTVLRQETIAQSLANLNSLTLLPGSDSK